MTSPHRTLAARLSRPLVVCAALLVFSTALPFARSAAAQDPEPRDDRLPLIETIDLELGESSTILGMGIDHANRRLLVGGIDGAAIVDLDDLEQRGYPGTDLADSGFALVDDDTLFNGRTWAFDIEGRRGFVTQNPFCGATGVSCQTAPRQIRTVDLETGRYVTYTPPQDLSNEDFLGLRYDPERDRIYALGLNKTCCDQLQGAAVVARTRLHAFDASAVAEGGSSEEAVLWSYDIPACAEPLTRAGMAAFLDVGESGDFLYFSCRGVAPGQVTAVQAHKTHGVFVVEIGEGDDPDTFTTFMEPLPGNVTLGLSSGHAEADRIFLMVADATGQRLFVYDAGKKAWTGSVPYGTQNVRGAGVNPETGRAYGIFSKQVRINDTGPVPATQGIVLDTPRDDLKNGHPVVDPKTRNVFLPGPQIDGQFADLAVFRDTTPEFEAGTESDPDAETHQIREAEAVDVTYVGGSGAYGARFMYVGGLNGTLGVAANLIELLPKNVRPEGGDRGLYLGRVENGQVSGDKRSGAASASAVSVSLDDATKSDLESKTDFAGLTPRDFLFKDVFETLCEEDEGCASNDDFREGRQQLYDGYSQLDRCLDEGPQEGEGPEPCGEPNAPEDDQPDGFSDAPQASEVLSDNVEPLRRVSCSDFGGAPETVDHATASVSCDAGNDTVVASATASASPDGLPISIAHASSTVEISRDDERGSVTVVESVAEGIDVLGLVHIGEVRSTATTAAKGRAGTASSSYEVTINQVRVVDPTSGKTAFSCGWSHGSAQAPDAPCDPRAVAEAINSVIGARGRVIPPRRASAPKTTGSPGGARAIVYEDEFQYYSDLNINFDTERELPGLQFVFYNDGASASRLIVHLAAVKAESKYVVGEKFVPAPVLPAGLELRLLDPESVPLADGSFEVYADRDGDGAVSPADKRVGGPCTTRGDGTGDCGFDDLVAGPHVVTQTAAPEGFVATGDFAVELYEGFVSEVTVVNGRPAVPAVLGGQATVPEEYFEIIEGALPVSIEKVEANLNAQGASGPLAFLPAPLDALVVLPRSLGQALLFAAMWSFLGIPLYLRWRRQSLTDVIAAEGAGAPVASASTPERGSR